MKNSKKLLPSLFLISLATWSSCGKNDDKDKRGNGLQPYELTPFEQLTGDWEGIYRALEGGKPIGEAVTTKVSFEANAEFSIVASDNSQAMVDGQWAEFQAKTLILKIHSSSMSRIGAAGKIVEPTYDLIGTSLRISSDSFELKLTKKAAPSTGGGGTNNTVYSGNWSCNDGGGRKTTILISEGKDFKLSSLRQDERVFIAQGAVTLNQDNTLNLTPTATSDQLPDGSSFELRQGGLVYELFLHRPSLASIKLGLCAKR